MQSKTTRGVRRLLVSTGVISLVLSVAAPAALAGQPDFVQEKKKDKGADEDITELITDVDSEIVAPADAGKEWVCHATSSLTNPFVLEHVSRNAKGHEADEAVTKDGLDFLAGLNIEKISDLNHLDAETQASVTAIVCGTVTVPEDPIVVVKDPIVVVKDPIVVVKDPIVVEKDPIVVEKDPVAGVDTDPKPVVEVDSDAEENPAPVPTPNGPKPVIVISDDSVTRPTPAIPAVAAPAKPASPAAPAATETVNRQPEVLGSVTTRNPGGATASVTALAATGTSTTTVLAVFGSVLLLAGLGLQLLGRRAGSTLAA